jgi:hypothetical protein
MTTPTTTTSTTTGTPTATAPRSTARRFLRWFDQHTLEVFNPPVVREAARQRREAR